MNGTGYGERHVTALRIAAHLRWRYPEQIVRMIMENWRQQVSIHKEFKKHELIKGLWLFRLKFLWAYKSGNIVLFLFLLYVLVFGDFNWDEDANWILGMIGISCYQVYTIYQFYMKKLE